MLAVGWTNGTRIASEEQALALVTPTPIRLAGGGALLPGIASRIEAMAEIGVVVAEDPLRCVLRGAATMLESNAKQGVVRPG